jgi:cation diffusion facilitator family transporter
LLGLVCANFGLFFADSVAALFVALIVLFVSYKLGKRATEVLLDKAPQETIYRVEKILKTYDEVFQFHSLKIRTAGADTFIKFNIHLSPTSYITDAHALCDRIEKDLNEAIPRSEIYIHAEPQDSLHLQSEGNKSDNIVI